MSRDDADIRELLERADGTPYGPESRALLDEALRLALESGDPEAEYAVRMRLVAEAEMSGDTDSVLSNFAWCAAHNDSDPARFPTQVGGNDLLWFYKWIPATLASNPGFARTDVLAAIDAMEKRYREAGVGLHGVLQARFSEAVNSGHLDEAERFRGELLSTPQDDYSHCEACSRAEQVDYLFTLGRDEEALALFDEIMDQGLSCGEEPESVMATVLLALLRADRDEDAERAHRLGYRMVKQNPALMPAIARHVEFCAVTGNHARALRLLERHLAWLAHDELDAQAHFTTLLRVAVATQVITAGGHGALAVRGSDDRSLASVLGEHAGTYTVEQFSDAAWAAAQELGGAFDRRDGSDAHAKRLSEARGVVLLNHPLPLGGGDPVRAVAVSGDPEPADVDGWIDAAAWAGVADDAEETARAIAAGLAADPTPRQRLALWGLRATLLDGPAREQAIAERVAAYRELGLAEEARFEAAHGALMATVIGEEGAALLQELLPGLASAELRARVHLELGMHHLASGRPQVAMHHYLEGSEAADAAGEADVFRRCVLGAAWAVPLEEENGALQSRLLSMVEESGPRANQAYDVLYLRAVEAVAVEGQPERALRLSGQALELVLRHRASAPLRQISRFRSELLTELGRHAEAAASMEMLNSVLVEQNRGADPSVLVEQGRSLLRAGRAQEALEVLGDAGILARDAEEAEPALLAAVEHWYGEAAEAEEYFGTAMESWARSLATGEEALRNAPEDYRSLAAAAEASQAARSIVMLAGRAGHEEEVHEFADRAVAIARAVADHEPGALPLTLQATGRALAQVGDEAGLELLAEAEQIGRADGAAWFAADVLDTRGRALLGLGRAEEGIPALLRAADEYAGEGDAQNAALGEYAVGRVLAELDRAEEALPVLAGALERVKETPGEIRSAVAAAYGDLLEAVGRRDEAEAVRALIS